MTAGRMARPAVAAVITITQALAGAAQHELEAEWLPS